MRGVKRSWRGERGLYWRCAEGLDNQAVARKLRCSLGMVGKWRARFLKGRLEGLYDEPRPGAPRTVSDAQVEQVVIQTLESTPRGETHWSHAWIGRGHRIEPDDDQPDLARLRLATASHAIRSSCRRIRS